MPEGPEVFCLAKGLNKYLQGKTLTNIKVYQKYNLDDLETKQKLVKVDYLSKKIIFNFEKQYLVSFLGMTGGWFKDKDDYSLVKLTFGDLKIYYSDVRKFGILNVCQDLTELKDVFKDKGPDWVLHQVTKDYFFQSLERKRNNQIAKWMMDTKNTTGIGNYLKSEALYEAKIYPGKLCGELTPLEKERLYQAIQNVIDHSVKCGGFTQRDYFSLNREEGTFVPKIYNQETINGEMVVKQTFKDNRTTYYLPSVQHY